MSVQSKLSYEFADFLLDPAEQLLSRSNGDTVLRLKLSIGSADGMLEPDYDTYRIVIDALLLSQQNRKGVRVKF